MLKYKRQGRSEFFLNYSKYGKDAIIFLRRGVPSSNEYVV